VLLNISPFYRSYRYGKFPSIYVVRELMSICFITELYSSNDSKQIIKLVTTVSVFSLTLSLILLHYLSFDEYSYTQYSNSKPVNLNHSQSFDEFLTRFLIRPLLFQLQAGFVLQAGQKTHDRDALSLHTAVTLATSRRSRRRRLVADFGDGDYTM